MHIVGIRDLKNRLTHYLKLTRQGDKVVVTDRGAPFAIIHSLKEVEPHAGTEEKLASLATQGLIRLPKGKAKLSPFKGVKTGGEPASRIIIGERR
jgi:prevent-host-death family protein